MARFAIPSTMDELSENGQRILTDVDWVLCTTSENLFQFSRTASTTPEEPGPTPSGGASSFLGSTPESTHGTEPPQSQPPTLDAHIETSFEEPQGIGESPFPAFPPTNSWLNGFELGHNFDFSFGLTGEMVGQPREWPALGHNLGLPAMNHNMSLDSNPPSSVFAQICHETAVGPPRQTAAYGHQEPATTPSRDSRAFGPIPPPGYSRTRKSRPRPQRSTTRNKDPNRQRQTAETRKSGACIRCRLHRIRCEREPGQQDGCCRACVLAGRSRRSRVKGLPCMRDGVTDAELVDHPVCPRQSWTQRWGSMDIVNISRWDSNTIHTINITQYVTRTDGVQIITYPVEVRRFLRERSDALSRKWKFNGFEESYDCEPYGIADMEKAGATMKKVVDDSVLDSIHFYISEKDTLLRKTYLMAYRYSELPTLRREERDLLKAVLRLWTASRMESRSDYICHGDTLGMMPHHCQESCPNIGLILTPPVFSAQMEIIMTSMILRPTKKEVLRLLRDLIHEQQRKSWFTVYLSLFILLHSCALLTAANVKRALKQGKVGYFDGQVIEKLHHGATILLAYFHHCNKGSHPFTMDWASPNDTSLGEFTEEQRAFMQDLCVMIDNEDWSRTFKKIRRERTVDHEYYFLSQMYEYAWKIPR